MTDADTKVVTGKCRLSFAELVEPRVNDQGNKRWSTKVLLPKSDTRTAKLILRALMVAYKDGLARGMYTEKRLKPPTSLPWGTVKDGDDSDYEEDEGCWTFNAATSRRPIIVDRKLAAADPEDAYSGAEAILQLNAYPYKTPQNSGVTLGLNMLQLTGAGEPFTGGGGNVHEVFSVLDDEDDDDDLM